MSRTRLGAVTQGHKHYFTGVPCRHGHRAERYTSNRTCVECHTRANKRWREAHRNAHSEAACAWARRNPERRLDYQRAHRKDKAHIHQANARRYRQTPTGMLRALCSATVSRLWIGAGHSRMNLLGYTAEEFISHLTITLSHTMSVDEARQQGYHVDHVVPVAVIAKVCANQEIAFRMAMDMDNLCMIPGSDNLSKGKSMNPSQKKLLTRLRVRYGETT